MSSIRHQDKNQVYIDTLAINNLKVKLRKQFHLREHAKKIFMNQLLKSVKLRLKL